METSDVTHTHKYPVVRHTQSCTRSSQLELNPPKQPCFSGHLYTVSDSSVWDQYPSSGSKSSPPGHLPPNGHPVQSNPGER